MKLLKILTVLILIFTYSSANIQAEGLDSEFVTTYNEGYQFQDLAVEQMIRNRLQIPQDQPIDEASLMRIYYLSFNYENSKDIVSLEDLNHFPNLTTIEISNDQGHSLNHLFDLLSREIAQTNILNLYVRNLTSVSDFSFLESLTHLTLLSIHNVSQSVNEANLDKLNALEIVEVINSSTNLYKMAFTAKNTNFLNVGALIEFSDTGEPISLPEIVQVDHVDFSNFTRLSNLSIAGLQIGNSNDISQITTLTQLTLNHTSIDTSSLIALTNLYTLELINVPVDNLNSISQMSFLIQLTLKNNQLTTLAGLEKMTQLDTLILNNNPITHFDEIRSLTNLVMIDLSLMNITDISILDVISSTPFVIGLSYNSILDLSSIVNYPQLSNSLILLSSQRIYLEDITIGEATTLPTQYDYYQREMSIKAFNEYYQTDTSYPFSQDQNTITWLSEGQNHLALSSYVVKSYEAWTGDRVAFSIEIIQNVVPQKPVTPEDKEDNTDTKEDNTDTNKEDNTDTKKDEEIVTPNIDKQKEANTNETTPTIQNQKTLPNTGYVSLHFGYAGFALILGLTLLFKSKKS